MPAACLPPSRVVYLKVLLSGNAQKKSLNGRNAFQHLYEREAQGGMDDLDEASLNPTEYLD